GGARGEPAAARPDGARVRRDPARPRRVRRDRGASRALPPRRRPGHRSHPHAGRRGRGRDHGGDGDGRHPAMMGDLGSFAANWEVALPGMVVAAAAVVVMLVDALARGADRRLLALLSLLGLGGAVWATMWLWEHGTAQAGFGNTLRADRYTLFFA